MGSGAGNDNKKKYGIIGVASLLLVAMVIGVAVTATRSSGGKINASSKAVEAICSPTDYKDACVQSINSAKPNSTDPRDLIRSAFDATMASIRSGAEKAKEELKKKAESDPRAKGALDTCDELMDRAVDDLKKSFDHFSEFKFSEFEDFVEDLRVWLSGAVTNQQTCIDAFDGIDSEAGQKLEKIFQTAKQLTSNGLAMATNLGNLFKSFNVNIPGITGGDDDMDDKDIGGHGRRLMALDADDFPRWVSSGSRSLLGAAGPAIRADAVVAKDGSGKFKSINDALKMVPPKNTRRFVIYIKEGVYTEKVEVTKQMNHVMFIGDGPTKTRITGNLCFEPMKVNTFRTATVAIGGEWFMAKDIGFENSAGPQGHQAVAIRVSADYAVFQNCHMDGYQDTLYVHTHRQFYRDCTISGTIDFIFGDAQALFQNCNFVIRKPMANQQCIVTAQGRTDKRESSAIVFQNCRIQGDPAYIPVKATNKAYLGRPWKEFSRTIIMRTAIDDVIAPEGWLPWNGNFALDTLFYSEYQNTGPGSVQTGRVKWAGIHRISDRQALKFTAGRFLRGNRWIPGTGVPYGANLN